MKNLLTTQEAAKERGVSDARIRQLVLSGTLPAEKFGKANLIHRKDLEQLKIYGRKGRPGKTESMEVKP